MSIEHTLMYAKKRRRKQLDNRPLIARVCELFLFFLVSLLFFSFFVVAKCRNWVIQYLYIIAQFIFNTTHQASYTCYKHHRDPFILFRLLQTIHASKNMSLHFMT